MGGKEMSDLSDYKRANEDIPRKAYASGYQKGITDCIEEIKDHIDKCYKDIVYFKEIGFENSANAVSDEIESYKSVIQILNNLNKEKK
jgi:hypothetical protein